MKCSFVYVVESEALLKDEGNLRWLSNKRERVDFLKKVN